MAHMNGRVNLEEGPGQTHIPGFAWRTTGDEAAKSDMIRGNWEPNALNQTFFSPPNVQIIQNLIRKRVYDESNGQVIDPQSTDELLIVMRSMYLTYGRNEPIKIREQIEELNKRAKNSQRNLNVYDLQKRCFHAASANEPPCQY